MRNHARVVVVGGGCVGAGVLCGLARAGLTDALLIERNTLGSGSTRLAGGFIPSYVRSETSSRLINRSIALYRGLDTETGQSVGWHGCGQMRLARSAGRRDEYLSYLDSAPAIGANARMLCADEVLALCPLFAGTEGIFGALLHPDDGYVSPTDVTVALAKSARMAGAEVAEHIGVTGFTRSRDGHWRVETTRGPVTCEHLVLATGNFARQVAAHAGLDLPVMPVVVQYWLTDTCAEIAARRADGLPEIPITRDEHFLGYLRQEGDGLLFGTYERAADLQLFGFDGVEEDFDGGPLPADFDANAWGFERAAEVVPAIGRVGLRANVRGPMQMTADGLPLVGPAWGADNLWLAEGVPGGILWGGGAGEALAAWIAHGTPPLDMNELDPRRFGAHATKEWIRLKAVELWGAHSDLIPPGHGFPAARPQAGAPITPDLDALGAVWGAADGWETALGYRPGGAPTADPQKGWRQNAPDPALLREIAAIGTTAGLADLTGRPEFAVEGPGAAAALDAIFAAALPAPGYLAPGLLLAGNGGILAQFTVLRLAADAFRIAAPEGTSRLAGDILRRHLPPAFAPREVTAGLGRFRLSGPAAGEILAALADRPVSGMSPGELQRLSFGLVPEVRLARSGTTEWELVFDLSYQRGLFAMLRGAGVPSGLEMVGTGAFEALRIANGVPAWRRELHIGVTPAQAGLRRRATDGFQGADMPGRAAAPRLVLLGVAPGEGAMLGLETVWCDDRPVGRTTSTTWIGTEPVALAFVDGDLDTGAGLGVSVLGERHAARLIRDIAAEGTAEEGEAS